MNQNNGNQIGYRNFASPLSDAGSVELPYSGTYDNPGYEPSCRRVHAYDIGGTLAGAKGRDEAIRQSLGLEADADIKKVLFTDTEMTKRISEAQEKGILEGDITVNSLDGVVDQLSGEQDTGEEAVLITVGTYQMARSFLHGAKLEDYVSALVTSEEAESGNKKTVDVFVRTYERLREKGQEIATYCDDSENDALAAVEASRTIEGKYGKGFKVYLIKKDAADDELGKNDNGYIVIRSIADKGLYDHGINQENQSKETEASETDGSDDSGDSDDEDESDSSGEGGSSE